VEHPTRDAVVLTFTLPEHLRASFRFLPGQYLTLAAEIDGEELRRPYSICTGTHEPNLQVAIKCVPDGAFSNWAKHLRAGEVLRVMPPQGRFTLAPEVGARRHYLAFAAGSGITPILSILKSTLANEPASRVTLFYGNRAHSSTLFREELCELKDRYLDRFQLAFVMSREHQDLELLNGRIDAAKCALIFARWVPLAAIDAVYVCGPGAMIDEVLAALRTAGYPEAKVKTERFVAAPRSSRRQPRVEAAAELSAATEVTIVQDGQRRSFLLAKNSVSILDGAASAGIELPHSCKSGMCSTCRAKLVEGEVDMDTNYALEDYEVTRGYVLCCQSFPITERVVVDFDQG
jgi:ring-1,2-phenylacetyl-CoA epoxidase subunit PaaE